MGVNKGVFMGPDTLSFGPDGSFGIHGSHGFQGCARPLFHFETETETGLRLLVVGIKSRD